MKAWMLVLAVSSLYLPDALAGKQPTRDGEGVRSAAQSPGGVQDEQAIRQVISVW